MKATIVRESPVKQTGRVLQMAGLFDLPPATHSRLEWNVDMPLEDKPWSIGLIVGPSGSGKSSIAREMFGANLVGSFEWPTDKSVLDSFPERFSTKEIVEMLSSVGFNSPPAWLRPFGVLSNGEMFRVTCARAMAETQHLLVVDEFSSLVDRQVAQIASHAIQKTIRKNNRELIAVSCHFDIIEWLNPDWIYEPAVARFQWRELQRHPDLTLEIQRCDRKLWQMFRQHHYLSGDLHPASQCFAAYLDGQPVAFNAYIHFPHARTRNIKSGHRLVVLPDYQGMGIGGRFDDWVGQFLYEQGYRYHNSVAHPSMIAFYSRSKRWRRCSPKEMPRSGVTGFAPLKMKQKELRRVNVISFEYMPPAKVDHAENVH